MFDSGLPPVTPKTPPRITIASLALAILGGLILTVSAVFLILPTLVVAVPSAETQAPVSLPPYPITFLELQEAMATQMALSPEPIQAIVVTETPAPTPALPPFQATAEAQKWNAIYASRTATAVAEPKPCTEPGLPGSVCFWPTPTAIPEPTWTPLSLCSTPIPGSECVRNRDAGSNELPASPGPNGADDGATSS